MYLFIIFNMTDYIFLFTETIEMMKLFYYTCYAICLQLSIPPLMDWASHLMTMEIKLIFYACLILIVPMFFDQFITPLVIIVILDHLFKAASTMEDHKMALLKHICDAIYYTLALSCINSWMDPSTDTAKELFFVLSPLHY
jgi:hypothetical protein